MQVWQVITYVVCAGVTGNWVCRLWRCDRWNVASASLELCCRRLRWRWWWWWWRCDVSAMVVSCVVWLTQRLWQLHVIHCSVCLEFASAAGLFIFIIIIIMWIVHSYESAPCDMLIGITSARISPVARWTNAGKLGCQKRKNKPSPTLGRPNAPSM